MMMTMPPISNKQQKSILKHKTLDESIGSKYEPKQGGTRIRLGLVDVCVFLMTAGDNPCVSKGVPIQINWKPEYHATNLTFEQVDEAHHKDHRHHGGTNNDNNNNSKYPRKVVNIPATKRTKILQDNGIPQKERLRSQKMATIIRNQRKKSIKTVNNMEREEKIEELKKLLTCYKEEVLEYPQMIERSAATSAPHHEQATSSQNDDDNDNDTSKTPMVCKYCSLVALSSNGPAFRHMYTCKEKH